MCYILSRLLQIHLIITKFSVLYTCYFIIQVNPALANIYDLEDIEFGQCNLVIIIATAADAGTYECSPVQGFDPPVSAELVVLGQIAANTVTTDIQIILISIFAA